MVVKPDVIWGSSYGNPGGSRLTDYSTSDGIGEILYSRHPYMQSDIELNAFSQELADYILTMLGSPTVRVELTIPQLYNCIQESVSMFQGHIPMWANQLAVFKTVPGENVYEIPQFILDGLDYVVYKKTLLSIQSAAGTLEFDYFIKYFQDAHLFSDFSVGEFYILQMHLKMVRKILSQEGSFDVLNNMFLQVQPTPVIEDYCILQYRALDSNTICPRYKVWLKRYALACAKEVLGQIRGKYKTLPGPGGGAQLNGEELLQQSEKEKERLIEELIMELEEPPIISTY